MPSRSGEFNLVVAKSVLHHIDDAQARKLFAVARQVLAPAGRLVTLDAGFAPGQSVLSRFMVGQDRGANVRTADAYVELARESFEQVEATVHHDLLWVPYTHVFLDCSSPKRASVRQERSPRPDALTRLVGACGCPRERLVTSRPPGRIRALSGFPGPPRVL